MLPKIQTKIDKFLTKKNDKKVSFVNNVRKEKKKSKQVTLESLKGFINAKDFEKSLILFRDQNVNTFRLQMHLEKFVEKIPSRSILENTDILILLDKFRSTHEDGDVRRLAALVHGKWSQHLTVINESSKLPFIDVACDSVTTGVRNESKRKLKAALNLQICLNLNKDSDPEDLRLHQLAETMEMPIFYQYHSIDWKYKANIKAACKIIKTSSNDLFKSLETLQLSDWLWDRFREGKLISEKWKF